MKALIAAYARTPFHFAKKGALASTRPESLAAQAMAGVLAKAAIDPDLLEDVIMGCAYPESSQGNNIARIASFLAGLPQKVGGMTLNRFCGSSMSAVHMAAAQIEAGIGEAYLCVGVESMTQVPQGGLHFDPNPELMARYPEAYMSMGQTAENVAAQWGISRADQDALALESHQKAAAAQKAGLLADEIIPTTTPEGLLVDSDGCIRPGTSLQALSGLKPAFRPDGGVTAGTSSPLTDGAAAVLVVHEDFAERHGLNALARIETYATYGVDPSLMGIGPIPATQRALGRAGLTSQDLDVVEINEAFSAQALACIRDLGLDPAIVNIDGGALALGHPLGATGARITGKAAALLKRVGGRYALATQCIGGGQGIATLLSAL